MKVTQEQLRKAMECRTADELLALAQSEGVALTREQAEEYIEQIKASELSPDELANVAGGRSRYDVLDTVEAAASCSKKECPYHCSHFPFPL